MKCSTNIFKCSRPADSAEKKAVMFALLPCLLFIGFLTVVHRLAPRHDRPIIETRASVPPLPAKPVTAPLLAEPPPPDLNSRFRVVPANFKGINFGSRTYGDYRLSDGSNRELVLIDGQYRDFGNSQHWFDLNDVFYTDLTGDGNPEAIVMMTHLECGRTCDGGKNLVYIYSRSYPLQQILKYESGSGMEGCSLKSLTVKKRQLTLELFGQCPQPAETSHEYVRHETYDVTRLEFFFNGKQLVPKKKELLKVRDTSDLTHSVEIRINEERTPLANKL